MVIKGVIPNEVRNLLSFPVDERCVFGRIHLATLGMTAKAQSTGKNQFIK